MFCVNEIKDGHFLRIFPKIGEINLFEMLRNRTDASFHNYHHDLCNSYKR